MITGVARLSPDVQNTWGRQGLTIALRIAADSGTTEGIDRILSVTGSMGREVLFLGQWKSHLIVRSLADDGAAPDRREIGVEGVLLPGLDRVVVVSTTTQATAVYVDSQPAFRGRGMHLPRSLSRDTIPLLLFTDPSGNGSWHGKILALLVAGDTVSTLTAACIRRRFLGDGAKACAWQSCAGEPHAAVFLFDEGSGDSCASIDRRSLLRIPALFRPPRPGILRWDFPADQASASDLLDWILNAIGFAPTGFLLMAGWGGVRRKRIWPDVVLVMLACCGLSLTVEMLQVLLPGRYSQLSDLLLNTMGAGVGAVAAAWWMKSNRRAAV